MKANKLQETGACIEAVKYVQSCRNYRQAWNKCERGDWMLWIANRIGVDDKTLTHAKYLCANQVRHLMKDKRSIAALNACKDYVEGKITRKRLDTYADAAYADAAYAAAADAAAAAAYAAYAAAAAAYAAYAAADAADAAYAAAAAAYAAAAAAYAAAYDAAIRKELLKKSADICRKILTEAVFEIWDKRK